MNHSVKAYIEEIKDRASIIDSAKQFIEKETTKYKQAVEPLEKSIQRQNLEIDHIQNAEVRAELRDIISEIAKEWETTPEKITTKCFAYFSHTPTKAKTIYNGVKELSGKYLLNFSISAKEGVTHYTAFSSNVNPSDVQLDGNPISKYLLFAGSGSHGSKEKTLGDTEINNMVIKFNVGDLVGNNGKVKETGCAQSIINACELYSKKHLTPTM